VSPIKSPSTSPSGMAHDEEFSSFIVLWLKCSGAVSCMNHMFSLTANGTTNNTMRNWFLRNVNGCNSDRKLFQIYIYKIFFYHFGVRTNPYTCARPLSYTLYKTKCTLHLIKNIFHVINRSLQEQKKFIIFRSNFNRISISKI
jgi:hypothetical protein